MRNDYTEYLMHKDHKYLSKNWVKGKWQYIYDEKLGGKEKKAYEKAKMTDDHNKTILKVRDEHIDDAMSNRREARDELDLNQKKLSKYANKLSEASQKLKEAKSKDKNVFYSEVKRDLAKFDYDDANKAVSDSSLKYADSTKKLKNAYSEYSEASNNKFDSGYKLKSAKKAYDKTALAKIDKLKSKGKDIVDKLFSKQIAKKKAKKYAAQKSAREEGMAQREREKQQSQQQSKLASQQRNAEKEQIKALNSINKNIREHAYGEAEKQKQDAANKKRINDRVDDLIDKSNKLQGERFKDQLGYVGAKFNADHANRAMTPEEMNDYIYYYNSAKQKEKKVKDVNEKARIATHIQTIMDKTDGDVPEYLNKMLNDPYSASEEFWETLAENIEKPKSSSRRK